jgi:ComEC/Rec2-related protein
MTGIYLGTAFLAGAAGGPVVIALIIIFSALMWYLRQVSSLVGLLIVLVALAGLIRATPHRIEVDKALVEQVTAVRGTIASLPQAQGDRISVDITVRQVLIDDDWRAAAGKLRANVRRDSEVGFGDRVYFTGSLTSLDDLPPGVGSAFSARGIWASVYVGRVTIDERGHGFRRWLAEKRAKIGHDIQDEAPGDIGALLTGFVTGDDSRLAETTNKHFIATGTSHITAISGANFGVLLVVLTTIGRWSGVRRRWYWQITVISVVWFYAALTGLLPPAFRAAVVATGVVLALRAGRRPDLVTLILLSAAIEIAIRPADISTLSYRLSLVSSLALALVVQGLRPVGVLDWVGAALITTTAAHIATLPFLIPTFGHTSLVTIPTNILIAVPVTVAFDVALLGSALLFIWPSLGAACIAVAQAPAWIVLQVVDHLGAISWASRDLHGLSPVWQSIFAAMAVVLIAWMSPDCRAWAHRSRQDAAFVCLSRWALVGAVAGVIVGWGLIWLAG